MRQLEEHVNLGQYPQHLPGGNDKTNIRTKDSRFIGPHKREMLPQDSRIPEIPTALAGMCQGTVTKGMS